MEFLKFNHRYYMGVDLHSRSAYLCIMDWKGKVLLHRGVPCDDPGPFLAAVKPYRHDIVVGVETTFNWYFLSDLCRKHNIPFALGHALYMKAIHGGKKKNDRVDSKTIAELLRSGMFPPAYDYPENMRATRDLLRRRHKFVQRRADLYRHINTCFHQQGKNPPALASIKKKSDREAIVKRLQGEDVHLSVNADFDVITALGRTIVSFEKRIFKRAKHHNRKYLSLLISIPGCGEISAFNTIYETHDIARFPKVQNYASYCRTVKGKHVSAGKTYRSPNQKIGNPYLKWTMSEIAVHAGQHSEVIKKYHQGLMERFPKGKSWAVLSHKLTIAIYFMLKNGEVFDETRFVAG